MHVEKDVLDQTNSIHIVGSDVRKCITRTLEKIYHIYPNEVLEGFVEVWEALEMKQIATVFLY